MYLHIIILSTFVKIKMLELLQLRKTVIEAIKLIKEAQKGEETIDVSKLVGRS